MPPTIHLRDVVGEMEGFDDNFRSFLNRATGELATVGVEDLSAVEEGYELDAYPQWQREVIQKAEEILASDDWLELPSKFEIYEWQMMRDFCYSLDAIHGSGVSISVLLPADHGSAGSGAHTRRFTEPARASLACSQRIRDPLALAHIPAGSRNRLERL